MSALSLGYTSTPANANLDAILAKITGRQFYLQDVLPAGYVPGVTDATTQLQAVINAADGQPVILPAGTILFSTISNVSGRPLILIGQGTGNSTGTVLQTTAAANIAIGLSQVASDRFHDLRDFTLSGTSTNLGGIAMGTGTFYVSFVRMSNVRVISFSSTTGVGGYGISLNSVQELDAHNVVLDNNYNNIYRPALGFCTAVSFHGAASHNGNAVNCGLLVEAFVGGPAPIGMRFSDQYVFENSTNEAIKYVGVRGEIVLDNVYFEQCSLTAGDIITASGTAAFPLFLTVDRCHFDAKGRVGAKNVNLDYTAAGSGVRESPGVLRTGTPGSDITTTANTICHFEDNAQASDSIPIYKALLGKITWSEVDLDGVRTFSRSRTPRLIGNGTAHTAPDYALSAGWGGAGLFGAVAGRDTGARFSVTAGAAPGANPTITVTFKDGTWTNPPSISTSRGDISAPTTGWWALTAVSATAATWTFVGTPVAASIYVLDYTVIGK